MRFATVAEKLKIVSRENAFKKVVKKSYRNGENISGDERIF